MSSNRTILLHCHIFKNGGSTIDYILRNNFGKDAVSTESSDGTFLSPGKIYDIASKNPSIKSVSSHKLGVPPPEHPEITFIPLVMLRDPLDRLRSMYLFYRRQQQPISHECLLAQRTSFKEFVADLIEANLANSFTNLQSCFFLAQTTEPSQQDWPKILRVATQTHCLGVLDLFEESLNTWKIYLRQAAPNFNLTYLRQNVSPNRSNSLKDRLKEIKKILGKKLVKKFMERNIYDYLLYEYARERITSGNVTLSSPSTNSIELKTYKQKKAIKDEPQVTIHNSRLINTETTNPIRIVRPGQEVTIKTSIATNSKIDHPIIGFTVKNNKKEIIFEVNNLQAQVTLPPVDANSDNLYKFEFAMPPLTHGIYSITLAFAYGTQYDYVLCCQKVDAILFLIPRTSDISLQGAINISDVNIFYSDNIYFFHI